jgi:hypothetical protein
MREFREGMRSFAVRQWWSFANYAQGSQREVNERSGERAWVSGSICAIVLSFPRSLVPRSYLSFPKLAERFGNGAPA